MSLLQKLVRGTVTATAWVLGWMLLAPAYLMIFVPLRLVRRVRGVRDPLGLAFPGPAGSLWRPRRPANDPNADHRMH